MHVLIADDDDVSRMILEGMLSRLGHSVVSAADGQGLLRLFQETPYRFDAVLTDVMMPGMNGLEAARAIRRIRRISVVAVTACGLGTRIEDRDGRHLPWGICDFFIAKPLMLSRLREVLAEIAAGNKGLGRPIEWRHSAKAQKELILCGHFFKCPALQEDNPACCHLHAVRRTMTFQAFKQQLADLPEEWIDEMLDSHMECQHCRGFLAPRAKGAQGVAG